MDEVPKLVFRECEYYRKDINPLILQDAWVINLGGTDMAKKIVIAKGKEESKEKVEKAHQKPGGSNVGKYKNVKSTDMAGTAGGAPKGSYPINTEKRAKAALAYAHNAPNPSGIKEKVYSKYPSLKKSGKK